MSFQYPQQTQPDTQPSDPTLLVIGGLLALMVLGGIVVVAAFLLRPTSPAPVGSVSFDIPTAREAYPAAVAMARAEDVGAQLASAAGAWTPNIDMAELAAGRTGWTFYFYLPATKQMLAVVADRATGARIASRQPWASQPDLLDEQGWLKDSPIGMADFLQKCQGDLNAQSDRQVIARLSTATENRTLVWAYQVLSPDQQVVCQAQFDARTGLVRQQP
jgi:hypothetical protein